MKINFLTILGALVVVVLTITLIRSIGNYSSVLPINEIYACNASSDCVAVPADGCGCSTGGKDTAINKKYAEQWRKRQEPTMCTMMFVECNEQPECVRGSCTLVPTR